MLRTVVSGPASGCAPWAVGRCRWRATVD